MANQVQTQEQSNKPLSITDEVLGRVSELKNKSELVTPPGYSAENALKSAYLTLQETKDKNKRCVLETCTKSSIANALLDMVIQGLNPVKNQCYFIACGNSLKLFKSYLGEVAAAKRLKGISDVKAYCIYEDDNFELEYNAETGVQKVTKYEHDFLKADFARMIGSFAVIIGEDGIIHTEVMNMSQLIAAWSQGYGDGSSGAHAKFKDQMAKKTVINRACKMYVGTSDDSDILAGSFNNSDISSDDVIKENDKEVELEINENANKKIIDIPSNKVDVEFKEVIDNGNRINETGEASIQESINQPIFEGPGF